MDTNKNRNFEENMVFALDIGTRSVIGVVGVIENEKLRVIAIEREEHATRAMIDGQIENIDKVSKVVRIVKDRLEEKLGVTLKRVSVAAAGRALKTQVASYDIDFPQPIQIDDEAISKLEAGAITRAEEEFCTDKDEDKDKQFYLVGYTVSQYYLDNYAISSLKEHHGKNIKVDVIATFLPSEVVESLYTTMNRANLEIASLTLEPIAAINAAIPANIRLLNLALVDIGAGTSDIAVCRDGSVVGYTMATIAGDE
ncbi:MAG: cell division protein FtsA, partial [Oscillospiraceae bacterium]